MRRTTFPGRFALNSIAVAGIALLTAADAKSVQETSVADDPAGDAFFAAVVEPQRAPDYLDLIGGEVTLQDGIFIFNFTLADPVPDDPDVPQANGANGLIVWQWVIDTDPTTFPPGFPLQPNAARAPEFAVQVVWHGGAKPSAVLIDRRPLLAGEGAIVTDIPFDIDGTGLSASVSYQMLGSPPSFDWFGITEVLPGGYGNSSFLPADFVPDNDLATWPGE